MPVDASVASAQAAGRSAARVENLFRLLNKDRSEAPDSQISGSHPSSEQQAVASIKGRGPALSYHARAAGLSSDPSGFNNSFNCFPPSINQTLNQTLSQTQVSVTPPVGGSAQSPSITISLGNDGAPQITVHCLPPASEELAAASSFASVTAHPVSASPQGSQGLTYKRQLTYASSRPTISAASGPQPSRLNLSLSSGSSAAPALSPQHPMLSPAAPETPTFARSVTFHAAAPSASGAGCRSQGSSPVPSNAAGAASARHSRLAPAVAAAGHPSGAPGYLSHASSLSPGLSPPQRGARGAKGSAAAPERPTGQSQAQALFPRSATIHTTRPNGAAGSRAAPSRGKDPEAGPSYPRNADTAAVAARAAAAAARRRPSWDRVPAVAPAGGPGGTEGVKGSPLELPQFQQGSPGWQGSASSKRVGQGDSPTQGAPSPRGKPPQGLAGEHRQKQGHRRGVTLAGMDVSSKSCGLPGNPGNHRYPRSSSTDSRVGGGYNGSSSRSIHDLALNCSGGSPDVEMPGLRDPALRLEPSLIPGGPASQAGSPSEWPAGAPGAAAWGGRSRSQERDNRIPGRRSQGSKSPLGGALAKAQQNRGQGVRGGSKSPRNPTPPPLSALQRQEQQRREQRQRSTQPAPQQRQRSGMGRAQSGLQQGTPGRQRSVSDDEEEDRSEEQWRNSQGGSIRKQYWKNPQASDSESEDEMLESSDKRYIGRQQSREGSLQHRLSDGEEEEQGSRRAPARARSSAASQTQRREQKASQNRVLQRTVSDDDEGEVSVRSPDSRREVAGSVRGRKAQEQAMQRRLTDDEEDEGLYRVAPRGRRQPGAVAQSGEEGSRRRMGHRTLRTGDVSEEEDEVTQLIKVVLETQQELKRLQAESGEHSNASL